MLRTGNHCTRQKGIRHTMMCLAFLLPISAAAPARCASPTPAPPAPLTLDEAISRGLEANLNVLLAGTRVGEADGTHERRLSAYLPHARLETPFSYQTVNIKAQGISFPNTPAVVGPFTSWDFRAYADQTLFDLQAYHTIKASSKDQKARRDDYRDARSQVIRQVAGQYLNAQSLIAQAEAAQSRAATSETLEKLARDRHDAGVATGIDVLRAQVQLANDRQSLLVARNAVQLSLMALARYIAVPLDTPLQLADTLVFRKIEAPRIEQAVTEALQQRPDFSSLTLQRASLEEQFKASRARNYPKVILTGNYGGSGQYLSELEPTGAVKIDLLFTIFDLDREGERKEITSRLQRIKDQIADQRLGIEQEVREALLNLQSAADQVEVAQEGLALAERELQLAEDRFRHGVADNIEVVNAQDALARAQQNRIIAITRHVDAKIALARALGDTEQSYRAYLGTGE